MKQIDNRESRLHNTAVAAAGCLIVALLYLNTGCGRSETHDAGLLTADSGDTASTRSAPVIPAPDIPVDAPTLKDVYPALSGGVLRLARLTDGLPDGVLLQTEGLAVTRDDLDAELDRTPHDMRDQLRQNAFFLLEQKTTGDLLLARARKTLDTGHVGEEMLIQHYFEQLVGSVSVSDAEIETFYEANREMVGGAPLDRVRTAIRQHLMQEKQQLIVKNHINELGREASIALAAAWVEAEAALALDNPLDSARASGTPTFVSFGADSCMPCQMMKPFREAIAEKYGDRLNVVYVHVNKDQVLASRYGVRGIPHIMFFDADGSEVHTRTGFMPQEQLEEWIAKLGVEL